MFARPCTMEYPRTPPSPPLLDSKPARCSAAVDNRLHMVLPTPSASAPIPFASGRHKMRPRSGRMTSAKPPLKINETIMEDRHRQPRDCSNPFPGAGAGRLYVAQHRVWKVFASPPFCSPVTLRAKTATIISIRHITYCHIRCVADVGSNRIAPRAVLLYPQRRQCLLFGIWIKRRIAVAHRALNG